MFPLIRRAVVGVDSVRVNVLYVDPKLKTPRRVMRKRTEDFMLAVSYEASEISEIRWSVDE